MRVIYADENNVLNLGPAEEVRETEVRFPVGEVIRSRGEGTFQLLVFRDLDGEENRAGFVPVETSLVQEGEKPYLVWSLTGEDPDRLNWGCSLEYTDADGNVDYRFWDILVPSGDGGEEAAAEAPAEAEEAENARIGQLVRRLFLAAATLTQGYFHPLCVPGTWVFEEEEGRIVPGEDPFSARIEGFEDLPCDIVLEVEDGFAVHGFYEDGATLPVITLRSTATAKALSD